LSVETGGVPLHFVKIECTFLHDFGVSQFFEKKAHGPMVPLTPDTKIIFRQEYGAVSPIDVGTFPQGSDDFIFGGKRKDWTLGSTNNP
jgi:hypothetical protein